MSYAFLTGILEEFCCCLLLKYCEKCRNSGQKTRCHQKYSRISIWRNCEIRKTSLSSYEKHRINSKLKISKSSYITSLTLDEFISRIIICCHMLFRLEYLKNSAVVSFLIPKCYEKTLEFWSEKQMSSKTFKNFNLKKLGT